MKCLLLGLLPLVAYSAEFDHTHKKWGEFLSAHVVEVGGGKATQVRYEKALKNREVLDTYLNEVSGVSMTQYNGFSDAEKQAFLINAYNAFTVKWILDNGIPKSIKDTGGFLRSPWKKKFFEFLGEESHLDRLEHDLARGQFNNCRFHFAFNCASIGCPALRKEPWQATKLKEQFETAARLFLTDRSRNSYDPKSNTLYVSKIFDWYGEDFNKDKSCQSVKEFVARYIPGANINPNTRVKFLDYNWQLNNAP